MPKVKSDSAAERRSEGSGWQGGQLFGSESTETTFTGGGFKDKEKATETLRLLDGRDINYQYQVRQRTAATCSGSASWVHGVGGGATASMHCPIFAARSCGILPRGKGGRGQGRG